MLNIFECPYATDNTNKPDSEGEQEKLLLLDTNDLFDLSEIAFRLELALAKAQMMTKGNDTIYEADFENGKVRQLGYFGDTYDLYAVDPMEEKLAKVKGLSKVPIRNRKDIYHALTDREILDKLLEQGLNEEHQKDKEDIIKFLMSMKDCIGKEDLINRQNSNASHHANNSKQRQQYMKCSTCQEFANIHCVNCHNDLWLCADHWKQHKADKHNSSVTLKSF